MFVSVCEYTSFLSNDGFIISQLILVYAICKLVIFSLVKVVENTTWLRVSHFIETERKGCLTRDEFPLFEDSCVK